MGLVGERLARALADVTPPVPDGATALGITGISGIARLRRWDVVVSADAPGLAGERARFVALEDGEILVDEETPSAAVASLAEAVERNLSPPYSAEGFHQGGDAWAVGVNSISIAVLPANVVGEAIEQSSYHGTSACTVDDVPSLAFPRLHEMGRRRGADYAARAARLDETRWLVRVEPL